MILYSSCKYSEIRDEIEFMHAHAHSHFVMWDFSVYHMTDKMNFPLNI